MIKRRLLSVTIYHLREGGRFLISEQDGVRIEQDSAGVIYVIGKTFQDSSIEITYPDLTTDLVTADSDGNFSSNSAPGQPTGDVTVQLVVNAIVYEDGDFETTETGEVVLIDPE